MKMIKFLLFTLIATLLFGNYIYSKITFDAMYEMELKYNLQKDKEVDIWENEEKKSLKVPYGIIDQDHILWLNMNVKYPYKLEGEVGVEVNVYNPEDKDYYPDITDIKKKDFGAWISYVDLMLYSRYFNTRVYKWRGHRESTDLLKLYRSDWDYNSSRYLGLYTPIGIEFTGNYGSILEGFFMGIGQTPALGDSTTVYIEYMKSFKFLEATLMYKQRTVPQLDLSDPDNILTYDPDKGYVEGKFTPPQYPNVRYIYDDKIIAFDTKMKTYYHSIQFEIAKYDVKEDYLYYGAKIDTLPFPYFLNLILMYENADKYAGNKKEYSSEIKIKPIRSFVVSAKYLYRAPQYGPLFDNLLTPPLVYENREATVYSASIIFDPTIPTSLAHWNANFMEDAPIAIKLEYNYTDYPTYTDNPVEFDWDANKYIIYGGDKGLYPCKLHNFNIKLISNYFSPYKVIIYFDTGLKQALWSTSVAMVPWTENYSSFIKLEKENDFSVSAMLLIDDWEIPPVGPYNEIWAFKTNPYDYNKEIGIPWDYYIGARIVKFLGSSSIELKYQRIIIDKDFDDPYENYMTAIQRKDMLKEEMNELSLTYKIRF